MNALPLIAWMLLALPGVALLRRFAPRELEGGLLPGLGVAWATSLAALAPVFVAGYLLRVPIGAASIAVVAFVAWGAVACARGISWPHAWRHVRAALVPALGVAGAIVVADIWLADRHGAILDNDSRVHVARIRFLLEHGLSNADPFVRTPIEYPYPIYHTNILHALCAVLSRTLAIDPLTVWFNSLAASMLLIASGTAYLAWAVLGGRWAPWIAAAMVVVNRGPYPFTIYPNQLAPWAFMPVALGVAFRALDATVRSDAARGLARIHGFAPIALVAGTSAVVGMMHPLYAGFLFVVGTPVLALVALDRAIRRRPGSARAAIVTLALAVPALAFPLASRAMTARGVDASVPRAVAQADDGAERDAAEPARNAEEAADDEARELGTAAARARGARKPAALVRPQDGFTFYERGEDDWIARTLGRGFTGGWNGVRWWRLWLAALCVGAFAWTLRRAPRTADAVAAPRDSASEVRPRVVLVLLLAGSVATVLVVTMVPPLCTLALKVLGAQWVLGRFETIAFVLWIPLSLPALAAALESSRAWRPVPGAVVASLLALVALPVAELHASLKAPYTWEAFIDAAMRSEGVRNGRQHAGLLRQQAWMREAIPRDAVVLAGPLTGTWISMLHGAGLVASERSSTGIASGRVRRGHIDEMFSPETDEGRRADLFHAYGVTHVLTRGRAPTWSRYWTVGGNRRHGHVVLTLRPTPDESLLWMRDVEVARAQLDRGNADGAIERLRGVIAIHAQSADAWFVLGNALLAKGDAAAAIEAYTEAERLEPDEPLHALMHGNALDAAGRHGEAIDRFAKCARTALAQSDAILGAAAWFNTGNALYDLDRSAEALDAYEEALRLDPMHRKALTARAWLRQDLGLDPPAPAAPEPAPPTPTTSAPSTSPTP